MFEQFGEIVRALATDDFYRVLKKTMADVTSSEMSMVMRYSSVGVPTYLCYDDLDPELMESYCKSLYRVDPVYSFCKKDASPGVFTLAKLSKSDAQHSRYLKKFLIHTGMTDDLIVLFRAPGSAMIALTLERSRRYASTDLEAVRAMFPLLVALQSTHERLILSSLVTGGNSQAKAFRIVDRHGRTVFSSKAWDSTFAREKLLLDRLDQIHVEGGRTVDLGSNFIVNIERLDPNYASAPGGHILVLDRVEPGLPPLNSGDVAGRLATSILTPRERDIVDLILKGFPNIKIAEKLGLSVNTIKNHKKRLYGKLDITTERELFLSFVEPPQIQRAVKN